MDRDSIKIILDYTGLASAVEHSSGLATFELQIPKVEHSSGLATFELRIPKVDPVIFPPNEFKASPEHSSESSLVVEHTSRSNLVVEHSSESASQSDHISGTHLSPPHGVKGVIPLSETTLLGGVISNEVIALKGCESMIRNEPLSRNTMLSGVISNEPLSRKVKISMPIYENNMHKFNEYCWRELCSNLYLPPSWIAQYVNNFDSMCWSALSLNPNIPLSWFKNYTSEIKKHSRAWAKLFSKPDIPVSYIKKWLEELKSTCRCAWYEIFLNPNIPLIWVEYNINELDNKCFSKLCENTNPNVLLWLLNNHLSKLKNDQRKKIYSNPHIPLSWVKKNINKIAKNHWRSLMKNKSVPLSLLDGIDIDDSTTYLRWYKLTDRQRNEVYLNSFPLPLKNFNEKELCYLCANTNIPQYYIRNTLEKILASISYNEKDPLFDKTYNGNLNSGASNKDDDKICVVDNALDNINDTSILDEYINKYSNDYFFNYTNIERKEVKYTDEELTVKLIRRIKRQSKSKIKNNKEMSLVKYMDTFESEVVKYFKHLNGMYSLMDIIIFYCRDYYPITCNDIIIKKTGSLELKCPFCYSSYKNNGQPYINASNVTHEIKNACDIKDGKIMPIACFNHKKEANRCVKMFSDFIIRFDIYSSIDSNQ